MDGYMHLCTIWETSAGRGGCRRQGSLREAMEDVRRLWKSVEETEECEDGDGAEGLDGTGNCEVQLKTPEGNGRSWKA